MTIDSDLQQVHLTMFNHEEKVFSGPLKDLPDFIGQEREADRVKVHNASGSAVATMHYRDLKSLIEQK